MSRIDFPSHGDTHIDDNGTSWKKINNSWVKQFSYSTEAPATGGVQYCKVNQVWTEIVFPVAEDDPNDAQIYARQNNTWVAVTANVGPAAPGVDGLLYGLRDGVWELIPGDDLTVNYYNKVISDGRFAAIAHNHTASQVTDLGELALVGDAPADGNQYARVDNNWVEVVVPAVPAQSKAITIIDPQATDDALLFFTPNEITLTQVMGAVLPTGLGGVTYNLFHSTTADGTGTVNQVFTSDVVLTNSAGEAASIDNPVIPANSFIWVGIIGTPVVGTTMFHLTVTY